MLDRDLVEEKTGLIEMYDRGNDGSDGHPKAEPRTFKVNLATYREIMTHKHNNGRFLPKKYFDAETPEQRALQEAGKAAEGLDTEPTIEDAVKAILEGAQDGDPRLTPTGKPTKAAIEEYLGREVDKAEFMAAINK